MDYETMKDQLNVCDTGALIIELQRRIGYDLNTLLRCNGCLKLRFPKIEKLSCLNCARMKIDYFLQDISEPLGRGVDE